MTTKNETSTPRLVPAISEPGVYLEDEKTIFKPLYLYTDKWSLEMVSLFHKCKTQGFPIPVYPGVLLSHVQAYGSLGEKLDQIAYQLKILDIDLSSPFFHHVWYRLNGVVRTRLNTDIERTPEHQKVIEFMVSIGVDATAFEIVSTELQKVSYTLLTYDQYQDRISNFLKGNFKVREIGALVKEGEVYYLTASKLGVHAKASFHSSGSQASNTPSSTNGVEEPSSSSSSPPSCLIYLNNKTCTDHTSAWKTIKRALDDGWRFHE